ISSPLLENMSVAGAHGVLFNITGGKSLGLHEISEAASVVYEQAHEDANIIIGSVIDESLQDEVIVTIIATEFNQLQQGQLCVEKLSIVHEPCVDEIKPNNMAQESFISEEPIPAEKQHAFTPSHSVATQSEDLNDMMFTVDSTDLDIPAFMRHKN